MVEQSFHPGDPRRCDFNVEKEVIGYGKGVNEQVIEGHFVRHVPVPGVSEIHRCNVNQKQVNKQVVEIEEGS